MRNVTGLALLSLALLAGRARADNVLHAGTPELDPPTVAALGVHLPITGDDNFNASVAVRYRRSGDAQWNDALPLMRIHAEAVTGMTVGPGFAGSIFDLRPGTTYDIELHATDPDGGEQTVMISGTTRMLPSLPVQPHAVLATSAATLTTALAAAEPGDVITLDPGTYAGTFSITASGTAANPIVIRGRDEETTILDGGNCAACNVLEVYGSYIHVETLTLRNANRALRFQTAGARDNVVQRVHIKNVVLGIGSKPDQQNFYIADNTLEGRLVWPCVYTSDDLACNGSNGSIVHGLHANDDGIHVEGEGHVIAYNQISGFGDAMKTEQDGVRSIDFYGNEVLWTYDNGIELDGSLRNTRALRNRFTNTFATLSFQPIFGGPAYAIKNVIVNVADEQFKLHSRGTTPTVGAVLYHNTVIRATRALQCATSASPLYVTAINNLFVGPMTLADGYSVRWDVPDIATATIDSNAYFPDGKFELGYGTGGMTYGSFAEMSLGTFDHNGHLVTESPFVDGQVGPDDWQTMQPPRSAELQRFTQAGTSSQMLPNVSEGSFGAAMGAIGVDCAPPHYGPRPLGDDESNTKFCQPAGTGGGFGDDFFNGGDDVFGDHGPGAGGGCCGVGGEAGSSLALASIVLLALRRRR